MKVIDLLNKIANDEEVPKRIKYISSIWEYDENTKDYIHDDIWLIYSMNSIGLTEREVEIIEEPQEHKIPKKLGVCAYEEGEISYSWSKSETVLKTKINEIIDYLEENK